VINITFDQSGLNAELDRISKAARDQTRPAAQAGAQVFYDEMKARAPESDAPHFFYGSASKRAATRKIYRFEPGALKAAIYQVFSRSESTDERSVYHIAWNHRKVPYGFMYEYGHIQTRKVYQGSDGLWYTSKALLEDGPQVVKPEPFLRPSYDAAASRALSAARDRLARGFNDSQKT
jgi:hypothetical protein